VVAPNPRAAAEYYPAGYWFSMLQIPSKTEFPGTGPEGNGIHGQILLGSVLSGIGAYVSVRFLMRYFQTRTLTPFAIYCFVFGLLSVAYLGVIK